MATRRAKIDAPVASDSSRTAVIGIAETRWQERPLISLQLASELAGILVASLYHAADEFG